MAAGCGRFLVNNPLIDDWLEFWKRVCSSWRGRKWRWSDLICCSTATISIFVLLGSFLFTLSSILLDLAPCALWHRCAVRAAFIARFQYCCVSTLELLRSLKLISSRNLLSAGTSSGAILASDSSSAAISSAFFLRRYPCLLSWREKLRNIHWEWVMWRIFEINCLWENPIPIL